MITLTGRKLTMQNRQKCAGKPPATFEGAAERVYMERCEGWPASGTRINGAQQAP
jgi:hypothetical protein